MAPLFRLLKFLFRGINIIFLFVPLLAILNEKQIIIMFIAIFLLSFLVEKYLFTHIAPYTKKPLFVVIGIIFYAMILSLVVPFFYSFDTTTTQENFYLVISISSTISLIHFLFALLVDKFHPTD